MTKIICRKDVRQPLTLPERCMRHTNNLSSWLHLAATGGIILSEKYLRDPLGVARRQTLKR